MFHEYMDTKYALIWDDDTIRTKLQNKDFDVGMGSYDYAEISKLYHNDGLVFARGNGCGLEKLRKKSLEISSIKIYRLQFDGC